jgi:thiol-disulfide isomerase/thioredoxin
MSSSKWQLIIRKQPLVVAGAFVIFTNIGAFAAPTFNQAVSDYNAGRYAQALAEFKQFEAAYPNNGLVHYYIGLCNQSLNQRAEAKGEYQWVIAHSDPKLKQLALTGVAALDRLSVSHGSTFTSPSLTASNSNIATNNAIHGTKVKQILDFSTSWCHFCKLFAPIFEEAQSQFRDIEFKSYDAEAPENENLVKKYGVHAYPTLVYLDASGNVLQNKAGAPRNLESFSAQINRLNGGK